MTAETFPDLGPCCGCRGVAGVINIVMLNKRAPLPGRGWGCVQCGLPNDGAVAVFCNPCLRQHQKGTPFVMVDVCRGYPGKDGRIAFEELPDDPFDHDMTKHPEHENER